MVNYREILRLKSLGYSQRQIAASAHRARDVIRDVCKLADEHNLKWPLDENELNNRRTLSETKMCGGSSLSMIMK